MNINEVSIFIIIALCTGFVLAFSIVYFVVVYQKRYTQHEQELNSFRNAYDQALLQTRLEIQEQTFKTISQEIHDNIGQMLALLKLNLNKIAPGNVDDASDKLQDAKSLLGKVIADLRDLSKTLNSDNIGQIGLAEAIKTELSTIEKVSQLNIEFECNKSPVSLDPQVELILFRIIQESLHNIIKHAKASSVYVAVIYSRDTLQLTIKDDGVGFDLRNKEGYGIGLINMESRCKFINAMFSVQSYPGKGTEVSATVALPAI